MFSGKDLWKTLSRDSTQGVLNYYLSIGMYFVSIHPCLEQRNETKRNETGFKHSQHAIAYLTFPLIRFRRGLQTLTFTLFYISSPSLPSLRCCSLLLRQGNANNDFVNTSCRTKQNIVYSSRCYYFWRKDRMIFSSKQAMICSETT